MSAFRFLTRSLLIFTLVSAPLLGASVSLAWDPNTEPDLAGYWVYRTQTPGTNYARLNTSLQISASFVDSTAVGGTTYYYTVTAVNSAGQESGRSNEVQAVVPATVPTNQPPLANAGADQAVSPGSSVTLRCGSSDPDGDVLARSWAQISGPAVSLSGASGATATFTAPSVTSETSLVFRLTVNDGKGGSASDDVSIRVTVNSVNKPPTANAGADQTVLPASAVTLSGSGSDPDNDPITFSWSQTSGPAITLAGADTATLKFVAPEVSGDTQLTFRLKVTDNKGAQATDDVSVRVTKSKKKLVVPASLNGTALDNTFIGIAVLNTSARADTVQIAAVNSAGSEQVVKTSVFAPQAQEAFLTDAVIPANMNAVSLRAQADNGDARGFFMIGRGQPNQLDGVGGELVASTELFFPVARDDYTRKTFYFLTNTELDVPANITLEMVDQAGSVVRTGSLSLSPGASRLAPLPSLIGPGLISGEHYVRVRSDVPVQGFELMASADDFSSAAAQNRIPSQTLWIPHYILGRQREDTELRLINPGAGAVKVTLRIYNDQAQSLGTHALSVAGRGLTVTRLSELLGIDAVPNGAPFLTGHIVVDVSSSSGTPATLLGTATFAGVQARAESTLPMWRQPLNETLYLHVAQSPVEALFTGLAIMNPNSTPVSVTVRAWDKEGRPSAQTTIQVEAGQRIVDLLNGSALFGPAFQQIGGHLKVSSDQPVVSFVVFGDSQSQFLAAVEGQPGQ